MSESFELRIDFLDGKNNLLVSRKRRSYGI